MRSRRFGQVFGAGHGRLSSVLAVLAGAGRLTAGPRFRFHGAGMEGWQSPVDCSCLESSRPRKGPGGSNPSPSALPLPSEHLRRRHAPRSDGARSPTPSRGRAERRPDAGARPPDRRDRRRGRPARGRRRPDRAVGRAARRERRAGRGAARGRARRLRRERAQRRLHGRLAHARDRERRGALAGRDATARAARRARTSRRSGRRSSATASTRASRRRGELAFATAPYQAEYIDEDGRDRPRPRLAGRGASAEQARAEVRSPTYHGARCVARGARRWSTRRGWPGAWPTRRAARAAHLRALAGDAAGARRRRRARDHARRPTVRARHVVLATSAFPPLVRAIRRYVVPVYDYVLVTEPLGARAARVDRLGAAPGADRPRQPVPLLPPDRRGPDPVRRLRRGLQLPQRRWARTWTSAPASFELLAAHFFETFPQLEGLRFTHRWGGAIDTCSRFSVMFGRALGGRGGVRRRLHRPRRRRRAASARRWRSTSSRGATRSAPAWSMVRSQARPVPARAAALGRHHADPARAGARRPPRGPPRPLAAAAGPAWDGVRQLAASLSGCAGAGQRQQ